MRSMRRGIREMDIILSAFAQAALATMDAAELGLYEAMLEESDHDIYQWLTGQAATPEPYLALVTRIAASRAGGAA